MSLGTSAWQYPSERYYYGWYGESPDIEPTDSEIKSAVVDRLRGNMHTKDHDLRVDVKKNVVVLTGEVSTTMAKRAAGDDCWDTAGVVDVSNQLAVVHS